MLLVRVRHASGRALCVHLCELNDDDDANEERDLSTDSIENGIK